MEILPVGGYEEVGRNMTLIKSKDDAVIIDMGIRLDRVMIHEDTDTAKLSKSDLVGKGIIPDDSKINDKIKAIIVSHGHLYPYFHGSMCRQYLTKEFHHHEGLFSHHEKLQPNSLRILPVFLLDQFVRRSDNFSEQSMGGK